MKKLSKILRQLSASTKLCYIHQLRYNMHFGHVMLNTLLTLCQTLQLHTVRHFRLDFSLLHYTLSCITFKRAAWIFISVFTQYYANITLEWWLHIDTPSREQWLHLCELLMQAHVVWLQELTFAIPCITHL